MAARRGATADAPRGTTAEAPRGAGAGVARVASPGVARGKSRSPLRVATWNINSLRLRLPLLQKLISALDPDVVCLQETKVPDEFFPRDAPAALGYPHAV
jgi:hypothetical protein